MLPTLVAGAVAFHAMKGAIPARANPAMNSAEEEARRRWLAKQDEGREPISQDNKERTRSTDDAFAMKKAARERMVQAMGDSGVEKLNRGLGSAFGFGMLDDENYGYGPPPPKEPIIDDNAFGPEWLTSDPVQAKDLLQKQEDGYWQSESSVGHGFDGREANWKRKAEMGNPNPPSRADTLRAPNPDARPIQSFMHNYGSAREDARKMQELDALEQEEELLAALMGEPTNTTAPPKGSFDSTDFWS